MKMTRFDIRSGHVGSSNPPILLHLDNELQLFAQKEGNFLGQSFHPSSATETFFKKSNSFGFALCTFVQSIDAKTASARVPGRLGTKTPSEIEEVCD